MDLGIRGKHALVCGASRGLGHGCAEALAAEGVHLTLVARHIESLEAAAQVIRRNSDSTVTTVACDLTSAEGRAQILSACPQPDILITNTGGPPTGNFRDWDESTWLHAINALMLTPIALIKATVDGMIARRFGRIINITSSAVKAPLTKLGLSNGARSGLTGFVAGLARETVVHNVTINNLLPGPFDTERLRTLLKEMADAKKMSVSEAEEAWRQQNPAQRFGTPAEFGAVCAFLCSVHTGYITGQNILLDGGAYPGMF